MVIWTAVALRKRFAQSREFTRHESFCMRFSERSSCWVLRVLVAADHRGCTAADALDGNVTVIHTVVGAILFAFSVLVALMCYRLVPRGTGSCCCAPRQVTTGMSTARPRKLTLSARANGYVF